MKEMNQLQETIANYQKSFNKNSEPYDLEQNKDQKEIS